MNRWVGLGVIADNVLNLGRANRHASRSRRSSRRDLRCIALLITTPQHANFAAGK